MDKNECFAFFCEDIRSEAGNKTSYMGLLGPTIGLTEVMQGPNEGSKVVLPKLVAVALVRSGQAADIVIKAVISIKNLPGEEDKRFEIEQALPSVGTGPINLRQFHIQMPNCPAYPGIEVSAEFQAGDSRFGATLFMID